MAVRVAGDPTAEELAAVLAALAASSQRVSKPAGYRLWRETRLRALAAVTGGETRRPR
jgi:hypothetical protein